MVDAEKIRPLADLREANLHGANLRGAKLFGANLRGADLREAGLLGADLRGANLRGASLFDSNLRGADLSGADLRDADLRGADLRDADLSGADLRGADLRDADLIGAKNIPAIAVAKTSILPAGEIIGWKKALHDGASVIVELMIPADAKRSNGTGRKCRASKARVMSISGGVEAAVSTHDPKFIYRIGETVEPRAPFCKDRWNECASGIHFFITREEAEEY